MQLTALLAEENASNAQAQAVYELYLANAKRYDEAVSTFTESLELDRNCWPAHYGLAKIYVAMGKQEKAFEHGTGRAKASWSTWATAP